MKERFMNGVYTAVDLLEKINNVNPSGRRTLTMNYFDGGQDKAYFVNSQAYRSIKNRISENLKTKFLVKQNMVETTINEL